MVSYSAKTKKNALMKAREARKMGYEVKVYRKRKGYAYGISVTRKK